MKTTGNTNNMAYLQQFAVKGSQIKTTVNTRAVIYNRCSSEKQDSLQQQDTECINLCKEYRLEIIRTYSEKESAETDDRKAFLEMLKFCEDENIGHIVVYNFDRFTRSGDVGLLKQLRDKGIRVHSVKQRVDDETSSGQFSQSLFVLFAKWENDQRRDRVILGQRTKLRRGEWIGKPTTGYKKDWVNGKQTHDLEKKQCFINEDGLKLRQAFYWKDRENLTYIEIIDRLAKMGLTLAPCQLTRIFRNPFYCGYITSSLLDDGEIIRGKHEPLVSEDVFLRVNGIVNGNPHGWKMVRQNEEMPLKSSVRCGKCNRPLTAYARNQGAYVYYKCPNRGCKVNVRNLMLHDLFAAELSKLTIVETLMPEIKVQLEATYNLMHSSEVAREKPMKDELTRLKNELEQMELNLLTSKVTPELFEKFSGQHKQKIKEIEASLNRKPHDSSNMNKMLDNAFRYSCNLMVMWKLLDYNGKVRLQKLVFPKGLQYISENEALRTHKINPIISAITSLSMINEISSKGQIREKSEKLRQLYLTFPSSNFFWAHLEAINTQMIDFERDYSQVWQSGQVSYLNQGTGRTETAVFNYSSNHTMSLPEPGILSQDLFPFGVGLMSGTTMHLRY